MSDDVLCPTCDHGFVGSQPLTFKELEVGDRFIVFPVDGDDHGHGGLRGRHNIFEKIATNEDPNGANATRAHAPWSSSRMTDDMRVLRVQ